MALDTVLVALTAAFLFSRARRGFAYSVEEFFGIGITFAIAFGGYPLLSRVISAMAPIPVEQARLLAFSLLLVVGQFVYHLLTKAMGADYGKSRSQLEGAGHDGGERRTWHDRHPLWAVLPALMTGFLVSGIGFSVLNGLPVQQADAYLRSSSIASTSLEVFKPLDKASTEIFGEAVAGFGEMGRNAREGVQAPEASAAELMIDTAAETRMAALLNAERQRRGLGKLTLDLHLQAVARGHSGDMVTSKFFDHVSPNYGGLQDRLSLYHVRYEAAGENLAQASDVDTAFKALMKSDSHRKNMLRGDFTKVGIGALDGGPSGMTFTQEFSD